MRKLLTLVILAMLPAAMAHAVLLEGIPETVPSGTTALELVFSEAVETTFSVFQLYSLSPADLEFVESENTYWMSYLLDRSRTDNLIEIELGASGTVLEFMIAEPLPAGEYLLVWRLISVDTHVSNGYVRLQAAD